MPLRYWGEGDEALFNQRFLGRATGINQEGVPSLLAFGDDPHGMNDARDVAKQCQENVDPKVLPNSDLEEYTKRR